MNDIYHIILNDVSPVWCDATSAFFMRRKIINAWAGSIQGRKDCWRLPITFT